MRRLVLCASIAVVLFAAGDGFSRNAPPQPSAAPSATPRRPSCPASPSLPPTKTPASCAPVSPTTPASTRLPTCRSAVTESRQSSPVSRRPREPTSSCASRMSSRSTSSSRRATSPTPSTSSPRRPLSDAGRRRLGRDHGRAGARAAAERPQLPPARDADAWRQCAGLPERQGQGAARRLRPLGQRQRRHGQPLDRRRRQQQRRRLEPHDPRLPVARSHLRVQDPAQQLRPRVRRRRRRADQHRHAVAARTVSRDRRSTQVAATRSTPRTTSWRRPTSRRTS